MPKLIVIASGNAHKAEEIQVLLGNGFECRTLKDYPNAPEVEETATTIAGNAVKKALSLVDWLKQRNPAFAEALADTSTLRVAVNQEFASFDTALNGTEEVALFPPMTGG